MVVAPALIPKRAGERIKTNRRDAVTLARLYRAGDLTGVWAGDAAHPAVRDLGRRARSAAADLRRKRQQSLSFLLGGVGFPAEADTGRWRIGAGWPIRSSNTPHLQLSFRKGSTPSECAPLLRESRVVDDRGSLPVRSFLSQAERTARTCRSRASCGPARASRDKDGRQRLMRRLETRLGSTAGLQSARRLLRFAGKDKPFAVGAKSRPPDPRAPSSTPSAPNKTLTEIFVPSSLLRFDPPAPPNPAGDRNHHLQMFMTEHKTRSLSG